MKNNLIVLLLALSFTSCRKLMRISYGMKQPKIESNASINEYLQKINIVTENVFYIDSAYSYGFWKDTTRFMNLPDVEIYNGNGELIKRLGRDECSGVFSKMMSETRYHDLKPIIIEPKVLDTALIAFRRFDGVKVTSKDFKKDEIIVCITFMKAFGKLSLNSLNYWTTDLKKNPDADKIKILYIAFDPHKSWGIKSRRDPRRVRLHY